MTWQEATTELDTGPTDCPIFIDDHQHFSWATDKRPIEQMFQRMGDLQRSVSVQVLSPKAHKPVIRISRTSEQIMSTHVQVDVVKSMPDTRVDRVKVCHFPALVSK